MSSGLRVTSSVSEISSSVRVDTLFDFYYNSEPLLGWSRLPELSLEFEPRVSYVCKYVEEGDSLIEARCLSVGEGSDFHTSFYLFYPKGFKVDIEYLDSLVCLKSDYHIFDFDKNGIVDISDYSKFVSEPYSDRELAVFVRGYREILVDTCFILE